SSPCAMVFFFQAEDGIRDFHVTGVQTCALPIFIYEDKICVVYCTVFYRDGSSAGLKKHPRNLSPSRAGQRHSHQIGREAGWCGRSEERRVGKACRFWTWPWE